MTYICPDGRAFDPHMDEFVSLPAAVMTDPRSLRIIAAWCETGYGNRDNKPNADWTLKEGFSRQELNGFLEEALDQVSPRIGESWRG